MATAIARVRIPNAYTMATAEAEMRQLHKDFEAGRVSREQAIIKLAVMTEQKLFDVAEGDKIKNATMYGLFAIFRDGAKAQETSDMSLRSKALKACIAAQLCRDSEDLFSATLAAVAKMHAEQTNAVKKDKKLPKEEQKGLEYPRQLIEAYYETAKAQVDSKRADPLDDAVIETCIAKPPKPMELLNEHGQFCAYIDAIVEKFNPLVGSIDGKSKPKKLLLSQSTIDALRNARNVLTKLAAPAPVEDPQVAEMAKKAVAYDAMMAEQAQKKMARDAKKNGNGAPAGK